MPGRNLEQLDINSWYCTHEIEEPVRSEGFNPLWDHPTHTIPTGLQSLVTFPMPGTISNRLFSVTPMETTMDSNWYDYKIKLTYDLNDYTPKKCRQLEIE
mgnify:CR=1 FL=1